jgi:hypothetical protein
MGPKNENKPFSQMDAPALASGLKVDPTPVQDRQDRASADVHEEDIGAHNVADSSRPSADYLRRQDPGVNWLKDAGMLPNAIHNVRILSYPYQDPPNCDSERLGHEFFEKRAKDLIERLQKNRLPEKKYENVPIIFVGHGLGCLIILKAMAQLEQLSKDDSKENKDKPKDEKDASKQGKAISMDAKDANQLASSTAGIMLLDAPPLSSLASQWMRPWMHMTVLDALNGLHDFFHEKHGRGICVSWFHDRPATSVRVCLDSELAPGNQ